MKIIPNSTTKNKQIGNKFSSVKKQAHTPAASFLSLIDETIEESIIETLFSEPDTLLSNISVLADELDKIGQELAEKPVVENFVRYKKHIRLLLKGAAHNTEIQEISARVGFTGTKLYRTAQAIDQALAELAQKILNDEKNRMDILKLTDQLKGLVLNILA